MWFQEVERDSSLKSCLLYQKKFFGSQSWTKFGISLFLKYIFKKILLSRKAIYVFFCKITNKSTITNNL